MTQPIDELLTALIRLKYPEYPIGGQEQNKELAAQFKLTPAAFSNYKNAKRTPSDSQASLMAHAWAESLKSIDREVLRQRLRDEAFEAAPENLVPEFYKRLQAATLQTSGSSPLQDFVTGPLEVSSLKYGVFSGRGKCFFDRLFDRYVHQLGVVPHVTYRSEFDLDDKFRRGEVHLALCYFASVNRLRAARFFTTPLRVSLGGVSHTRHSKELSQLATSLYRGPGGKGTIPIFPIVVRNEVGHLHCKDRLGIPEQKMLILNKLDVIELAEALEAESDRAQEREDSTIPVVIIDEYSALRVLHEMNDRDQSGLCVGPISSFDNSQSSSFRRELPQYLMSFACSREVQKLLNLFTESIELFLSTEVQTTARALADTFWALEEEVFESVPATGYWRPDENDLSGEWKYEDRALQEYERRIISRQYAFYTLSLDKATVTNPFHYASIHWRRILSSARQLILEETVAPKEGSREETAREETKRNCDAMLGGGQLTENRQLRSLNQYIDYELEMDNVRGLNIDELLDVIRTYVSTNVMPKPNPERAQEEIRIAKLSPQEEMQWLSKRDLVDGVRELLNQLGLMYQRLPDPIELLVPSDDKNSPSVNRLRVGGKMRILARILKTWTEEPEASVDKVLSLSAMDPGDLDELKRQLKGGRIYADTVGKQIGLRIATELSKQFARYREVLVATVTFTSGAPAQHVGMISILEQPGCRDEENYVQDPDDAVKAEADDLKYLMETCELRYLWVAAGYRGRNISRLLLGSALDWCRKQTKEDGMPRYSHARVAVLPQLERAIEQIRRLKFELVTPRKYDQYAAPGRLIFERKLRF